MTIGKNCGFSLGADWTSLCPWAATQTSSPVAFWDGLHRLRCAVADNAPGESGKRPRGLEDISEVSPGQEEIVSERGQTWYSYLWENVSKCYRQRDVSFQNVLHGEMGGFLKQRGTDFMYTKRPVKLLLSFPGVQVSNRTPRWRRSVGQIHH